MSTFTTQNENGIAVVTFDLPGEPVNKLSSSVQLELEGLLNQLRDDPAVRAVVLISGKADNFIAGADIEEFTAITTQAQAERLSFEGQETVSRIETSHKPIEVWSWHSPATTGSPRIIRRPSSDFPKCSSDSFPEPAAVSGFRGSLERGRPST